MTELLGAKSGLMCS